jgi:hypothetical protein
VNALGIRVVEDFNGGTVAVFEDGDFVEEFVAIVR